MQKSVQEREREQKCIEKERGKEKTMETGIKKEKEKGRR